MFRQFTKQPPPPCKIPEIDIKTDVSRASFVALIRQAALQFGSDRHVGVDFRPAVVIRKRDGFYFVLPSTTQHKSASDHRFYPIRKEDGLWTDPVKFRENYIFERYYAVSSEDLLTKIGVLHPPVQLQIVAWLRSRY